MLQTVPKKGRIQVLYGIMCEYVYQLPDRPTVLKHLLHPSARLTQRIPHTIHVHEHAVNVSK